MHGGNSRLSRRWLGAGRELLRSDCRGPPFKHLITAAVVAAKDSDLFSGVWLNSLLARRCHTLGWIHCVCQCVLMSQENVFNQENMSNCSPWSGGFLIYGHMEELLKMTSNHRSLEDVFSSESVFSCFWWKVSQEKKDMIRTSTTHSDQSQSRVLVEKVNEFMKCQKKNCFVFWLSWNSVVLWNYS